jgi:hypothetical protein
MCRGHLDERELNVWLLLSEGTNEFWEAHTHRSREESYAKGSDLAAVRSLRYMDGMVCGTENATGLIEKEKALLRESCVLRGAGEERDANLVLQIGELFANCRLCDMEPSRCSTETSLLCDSNEIAQMSQLHSDSLSVFPMEAHGKNCATFE